MKLKKLTTIATILFFTGALMGCSQNATSTGTGNTGSSQVAGKSQVKNILLRVAIGVAVSAIISSIVRKKREDEIEDTIRDTLNNL